MAQYPRVAGQNMVFREQFRTVGDVIENGGTISGDPVFDNGGTFDATGDGIIYPEKAPSSGSMSVRFKTPNITTSIIAMGAQTASPNSRCYLGVKDDEFVGAIGTQSWNTIKGGTPVVNTWHHGVMTWDGSNVNLYFDGVNVYSAAQAGTAAMLEVGVGGLNSDGAIGVLWNGELEDARMYNRALTQEEVSDIYQEDTFSEIDDSRALIAPGLRSWYIDGSGNAVTENGGSLGGTIQLGDGADTTTFPTQLQPQGMELDGLSGGDYISLPTTSADISGDFSVSILLNKQDKGGVIDNDRMFSFVDDADNGFQLVFDNSGKYGALLERGGVNTINQLTYGAYDQDQWVHIAYVVSGSTGTFYRNGEIVATDGTVAMATGDTNSYDIGRRGDAVSTGYFKGKIQKPEIFTSALTPTQIKWLYLKDKRLLNI